ncbi:hypothetical protein GCM10011344_14460 [Dokdonia pacifica]|uniref:DUF4301 domain-containing protein n=1 Tax=Dokdonia pacifica TaxID=1627892 RepID=A0A238W4Z5_9FLAO|nr:DUF4301 family protein [Dokdonia pacifica]GGG14951.1 hypothetical protein GCM10011344_14460 [Dokdonia pacifica]SNR41630.1 protein of unknown function [Dokdonia pacifica]
MNFTQKDTETLLKKGITQEQVHSQIELFKQGLPYIDLRDPAIIGHGIYAYTEEEEKAFITYFEAQKGTLDLLKFIPASGAATRMFKFLFEFIEDYDSSKETVNAYINRKKAQDLRLFFVGLDSFPFYKKVRKRLKKTYGKKDQTNVDLNRIRFVKMMLEEEGLNFGNKPKGLFPFHKYKSHNASAFEEHLFEAALYAKTKDTARLHFTISKEHYQKFEKQFSKTQKRIEEKTATTFDITYSFQSSATDTVAVTATNEPFRQDNGCMLFRPGGHGSLIQNLNEQEADIIFIKNIDNVVVHTYEKEVAYYKKVLAGKLLKLQQQAFSYLQQMDDHEISETEILEIVHFLQNEFSLKLARDFEKFSQKYQIEYLREQLDKPIRVCGMVKNEGEPGGGPFWVKHESGRISLQIVESVQIDPNNPHQQSIVTQATHFNPVDLVCGVKNYKGEKYDLTQFIDPKAAFIAHKTVTGKPIKALEHPGLWNGAMAFWNTIFVEVPLITFNPVKTVNDLLKPAHLMK